MSMRKIRDVLEKMTDAGYTAQNCAFGMGGGLLQKVNRDILSFATKLSHIRFADGTTKDIMKTPRGDSGKFSLPGELAVKLIHDIPTVVPALGVTPQRQSAAHLLRLSTAGGSKMATVFGDSLPCAPGMDGLAEET